VDCPKCAANNPNDSTSCVSCEDSLVVGCLEVVAGRAPERVFLLRPRNYSLGRSHDNELVLSEPSVSKLHATLTYANGQFTIDDKASLHGVYVNEAKITTRELTSGCEVVLGNVRLRYTAGRPETMTDADVRLPWIEHQQLLLSLVQAINSSLELDKVLERVLDALMRVTGAERGYLLLADEGSGPVVGGLTLRSGRRRDGTMLPLDDPGALSTSVVRRAVQTQELVATSNAAADPSLATSDSVIQRRLRSIVCVPLRSARMRPEDTAPRAGVLGALYVDNPTTSVSFSDEVLAASEALTRHAAMAIENAQLFESVRGTLDELKRTQKQLVQSEKLATIGQMASAIVHELNTPLTYIMGCVELMLAQPVLDGQTERLQQIQLGAERIEALAKNLLTFSRPASEEEHPVPVNAVVERSLELCRYQILKAGVAVESHLATDAPAVMGVANQLEMALINLIVNALYAMNRGGRLQVATRRNGSSVEMSVADNGCGIPVAIRGKIFQPFVTTRAEGQGTGLGLSTVHRIVERHGGRIDFTTEEGQGTTFRVTLPWLAPEVQVSSV
jgi:signal transduction histidine kinase